MFLHQTPAFSCSLFTLDANGAAGAITRATAIATPASAELQSGDAVTFAASALVQGKDALVFVVTLAA